MEEKKVGAGDVFGTSAVFESMQKDSRSSAGQIVPLILELITPQRVIDLGCGTGDFLAVFKKYGIKHVVGVDGDWVDRKMLQIREEEFISHDLTQPFKSETQFDLACSFGVAQHLSVSRADGFIEELTRLAPVVVFNAPIPFQPPNPYVAGKYPLNEQWPEYWAALFKKKGFIAIDCLRIKLWNNNKVASHYAQSIVLYVRGDYVNNNPALKNELEKSTLSPASLVHPAQYIQLRKEYERCIQSGGVSPQATPYGIKTADLTTMSLKEALQLFIKTLVALPFVAVQALKRKLSR
ncbi:methyltransferase domain-containing protein [Candidatus Omnitrophota bacterium]